jgi:hypothetical protein
MLPEAGAPRLRNRCYRFFSPVAVEGLRQAIVGLEPVRGLRSAWTNSGWKQRRLPSANSMVTDSASALTTQPSP